MCARMSPRSDNISAGTAHCRSITSWPMTARAAADRLQSAAGRADERLSRRRRSGRIAACDLARRNAGGGAAQPRRRADASCDAGAAWMRRRAAARRRDIARECWHLATGGGAYAGSTEELTPLRLDWISVVPLATMAIALLLASRSWRLRWREKAGARICSISTASKSSSAKLLRIRRHSGSSSLSLRSRFGVAMSPSSTSSSSIG